MRGSRDNIDLVWNIAELSSLFERRTNVDGFLQEVVDRVALHMESDVCSIYLWDDPADALVLRATRGLAPGCPVSVCGEAGADPGRLPGIRTAAAGFSTPEAVRFAREALELGTIEETDQLFSRVS